MRFMKRNGDQYETPVGRRDFLKAATMAGAAADAPILNRTLVRSECV
jgi:hypothetical protein